MNGRDILSRPFCCFKYLCTLRNELRSSLHFLPDPVIAEVAEASDRGVVKVSWIQLAICFALRMREVDRELLREPLLKSGKYVSLNTHTLQM